MPNPNEPTRDAELRAELGKLKTTLRRAWTFGAVALLGVCGLSTALARSSAEPGPPRDCPAVAAPTCPEPAAAAAPAPAPKDDDDDLAALRDRLDKKCGSLLAGAPVKVRFMIGQNGKTLAISTDREGELAECVVNVVSHTTFPPSDRARRGGLTLAPK